MMHSRAHFGLLIVLVGGLGISCVQAVARSASGLDSSTTAQPVALSSEATNVPNNLGITAVDPRFNQYGVYLMRLIEEVDKEWLQVQRTLPASSFRGTHVSVKFRITDRGDVVRTEILETTAVTAATRACVLAILNPAPYGKWTPDMIQALGTEQDLIIEFYYE